MARDHRRNRSRSAQSAYGPARLPGGLIAAALAALVAVWIQSGSAGLMAHPWRRGLTWLALGCVVLFGWPARRPDRSRIVQWAAVLAGLCVGVVLVSVLRPAVGMLGVVVLVSCLAFAHRGASRSALLAVAGAALGATVFRVALTSFGWMWLLADRIGWLMGVVGWGLVGGSIWGGALGKAPWIGATMAGLGIFVLMLLLAMVVALGIPGRRRTDGSPAGRLVAAVGAVVAAQLLYLGLFALLGAAASLAPHEKPPPTRLEALLYGRPMPRLELLSAKIAVRHWWTKQPKADDSKAGGAQSLPGVPAQPGTLPARPSLHGAQGPEEPAPPPGAVRYAGQLAAGLVNHWLYNLPALAVVLQLLAGTLILRWLSGFGVAGEEAAANGPAQAGVSPRAHGEPPEERRSWQAAPAAALVAAVLLAVTAVLLGVTGTLTLQKPQPWGRKIVIYEKGYLNWLRPKHGDYGRLSVGMYGMMPTYLRSLGAWPVISPELSETDLEDADAVVLLYPNEPWADGQLERLWEFVRKGGTLLVMGEHTVFGADDPDALPGAGHTALVGQVKEDEEEKPKEPISPLVADSPINQVLEPTDIRVAFDSATFAVGGWLHSYQTLSHPTTLGIDDQRNTFGVVIGASLLCRRRARPLIIGRWGWGDPGDATKTPSMMGDDLYDPGEKLGDLILAAEQPLGKGRVVVFGDTSGLTNGLTIGCHEYTSRLFSYLVTRTSTPQSGWRQLVGLCLAGLLVLGVGAAVWLRSPGAVAFAALVLAVTLVACQKSTYRRWRVLPDGRWNQPGVNNLAYVDAAQMNLYSREGWRPDGVMGLCLTLMRNDFLTLLLPEITADRLKGARLLVSVAPARELSSRERQVIKDFVRSGGIYVCTVGYEAAGPSRQLLRELGFQVGPRPEPKPTSGEATMSDALRRLFDFGRAGRKGRSGRDGRGRKAAQPREPEPLGHFKSPYFNHGDYLAYVRFHAAWPVWFLGTDAQRQRQVLELAHHPPDKAVILVRRYGQGLVAVVGDTCFAMNKNLENEDGSPFEGMRENAWFWRYFLCLVRDKTMPDGTREVPMWYPPNPAAVPADSGFGLPGQAPQPGAGMQPGLSPVPGQVPQPGNPQLGNPQLGNPQRVQPPVPGQPPQPGLSPGSGQAPQPGESQPGTPGPGASESDAPQPGMPDRGAPESGASPSSASPPGVPQAGAPPAAGSGQPSASPGPAVGPALGAPAAGAEAGPDSENLNETGSEDSHPEDEKKGPT